MMLMLMWRRRRKMRRLRRLRKMMLRRKTDPKIKTTSIEHRALTLSVRTPQCGHTVWVKRNILINSCPTQFHFHIVLYINELDTVFLSPNELAKANIGY